MAQRGRDLTGGASGGTGPASKAAAPEPDAAGVAPAQGALAPDASRTAPLAALSVTLGVQMLAAFTLTLPSVLAPAAAADLGVQAQHVGWLISTAYLTAMLSGLNGGWLAQRRGAVRVSQWALLACAAGLGLLAAGLPLLPLAAIAIGIGYGLTNPAAAEILSRHAPVDRRGLFFSIKQTGVPLGVALAGVSLPWLLVAFGWRGATLAMALPIAAIALWIEWSRRALEDGAPGRGAPGMRSPAPRAPGLGALARARLLVPLREVLAFAPTRRLALVSLVYAFTQVSFLTFFVSLLKIEHDFSLALSAGLLAASQAVSVVGRIGWGHVSDRWVDPTRLLGVLGLLMAVGMALLGLAPASTPWQGMLAITLLCAATAVAWNGVFFADLARQVPPDQVAHATGATQFVTFIGGMTGSGLFAALVSATGSYSTVYAVLSLLPAGAGVLMLVAARASRQRAR